MGFFESESEKKQREHNQKQKEGSEEGFMEELVMKATGADAAYKMMLSEHERKGLENGRKNSPED